VFHDHRMDSYRCNSVILIFMFIGNYNGLVGLRNAVKTAWAQIDVQLKRRYDLIPNLVETVKGYKNFESSTLQAVTNARSAAQAEPMQAQLPELTLKEHSAVRSPV